MKKTLYLMLALCAMCTMILTSCNTGGGGGVTIVFDTNGGSKVASINIGTGGRLPADYFRTGGNVPTKDGYRFTGWSLTAEDEAATISTAKTFWENTTLIAQWARRITVNFDLGSGVSGTPPDPVTVDEGTGLGSKYPPIPSRSGYEFDIWENGSNQYTAKTPIITNESTFTLTARWEKEYVPENAQSPAIHPGNHFSETGGLTRNVKVGESFIVAGLFSNIEKGQGVLSSKWYRVTSEDEAKAATANVPTGEVVLEQKAPDANPYELSLPFTWSEPAAGTYWYYVVVTNYYDKATKEKYSRTITQNKLEVTVTE